MGLNEMKFTKVRKVKSPNRAYTTDAGIDFFVPEDLIWKQLYDKNPQWHWSPFNQSNEKVKTILIESGERVLIPSGIHVKVPEGFALIAFNKSGISHKKGLIVGACCVDSGYEGEVHISLINTSNNNVKINAGDKIVQFILVNISNSIPSEVTSLSNLYLEKSNRGDGGFSSTGTN